MRTRHAPRVLHAWMNGEPVGRLERKAGKLHFFYAAEWLRSAHCRPISLSLPLRAPSDPWGGPALDHYCDNLLPETPRRRQQLQMQFGAASLNAFDLLAKVGTDCPGAIQFTVDDHPPGNRIESATPLSVQDIEQRLISLVRFAAPSGEHARAAASALGGFQDKTTLCGKPGQWAMPAPGDVSTHIVKLPFERHQDSGFALAAPLENAWLCQRVARDFGVMIPSCELLHFGTQKALLIERQDRRLDPENGRILCLPQEDMCQALGRPPSEKYQINGAPSLLQMAHLLEAGLNGAQDRLQLLRCQLVFWMLCAFDAHAKNFRLAHHAGSRFSLAPPLGVLSAYPLIGLTQGKLSPDKIRMALGVNEQTAPERWQSIRLEHWLALADNAAVARSDFLQMLSELLATALQISATWRKRLPPGFPVAVSEPILQGIVHAAQRLRAAL